MSNEKNVLFTIFGGTGDLAQRKLYPLFVSSLQKRQSRKTFCCHRYCSETLER